MARTIFIVATLAVLAAASAQEFGNNFDYFAFTIQWPVSNGCSDCRDPMFTIHGMWPSQDSDPLQPSYCGGTFDANALNPILSTLQTVWPSYQGQDDDFWSHEYLKHGSCATSSPGMSTEFGFFNTTVTIFEELSVNSLLNQAGITASNSQSYSVDAIQQVFQSQFGSSPVVSCDDEDVTTLTFCFTPNLSLMDCNSGTKACENSYVKLPLSQSW